MVMDINNFGPFNADVWGSVSDWFVALVTLTTAYYLYKTLKSQLKVQELGQTALEFERIRVTRETRPEFKVNVSEVFIDQYEDGEPKINVAVQFINIAPHSAFNVDVRVAEIFDKHLNKKWTAIRPFVPHNQFWSGWDVLANYVGPNYPNDGKGKPEDRMPGVINAALYLDIIFADVFGNNYEQLVYIIFIQHNDKRIEPIIKVNAPELRNKTR